MTHLTRSQRNGRRNCPRYAGSLLPGRWRIPLHSRILQARNHTVPVAKGILEANSGYRGPRPLDTILARFAAANSPQFHAVPAIQASPDGIHRLGRIDSIRCRETKTVGLIIEWPPFANFHH